MSDDLISVYGQRVKSSHPMEPMSKEELELSNIPEARRIEFETLKSMCAADCKYRGHTYREFDYCGHTDYECPFTCSKDAALRVCQGRCSQYEEYSKFQKFFGAKPAPFSLKAYYSTHRRGYYSERLKGFNWFETDKRRP